MISSMGYMHMVVKSIPLILETLQIGEYLTSTTLNNTDHSGLLISVTLLIMHFNFWMGITHCFLRVIFASAGCIFCWMICNFQQVQHNEITLFNCFYSLTYCTNIADKLVALLMPSEVKRFLLISTDVEKEEIPLQKVRDSKHSFLVNTLLSKFLILLNYKCSYHKLIRNIDENMSI